MDQFLSKIVEIISNPQIILFAGLAVEFVMRMVKTEKPMSIIRVIASVAKSIGSVLIAISDFVDKVAPQKLK